MYLCSRCGLWVLIIGSACASDDPSPNPVIVTVMTAEIGGILAEEDGCLRITDSSGIGGDAIVWQKDIFEIERRGNMLLIADLYDENAQPVTLATWGHGQELAVERFVRKPQTSTLEQGLAKGARGLTG